MTERVRPPLPPLAIRALLRFDVVAREVAKLRPASILEIGCGQGAAGARLARSYSYLGVEPDAASFAVAYPRVTAQGGAVLNATHDAVPRGAGYDLVCAFEVLEHIEDDRLVLRDWCDYIAPGGHLMLSVPAFQNRFGPMDSHAGHFRRYEPAQLATLLAGVGLTDIQITVYAWPLGYALEFVRNRTDRRKLAAAPDRPAAELTAASGRLWQPANAWTGNAIRLATLPFSYLQRLRPTAGTGLVVIARKP